MLKAVADAHKQHHKGDMAEPYGQYTVCLSQNPELMFRNAGLFLGPQELQFKKEHSGQSPPGMPFAFALRCMLCAASVSTPVALL